MPFKNLPRKTRNQRLLEFNKQFKGVVFDIYSQNLRREIQYKSSQENHTINQHYKCSDCIDRGLQSRPKYSKRCTYLQVGLYRRCRRILPCLKPLRQSIGKRFISRQIGTSQPSAAPHNPNYYLQPIKKALLNNLEFENARWAFQPQLHSPQRFIWLVDCMVKREAGGEVGEP